MSVYRLSATCSIQLGFVAVTCVLLLPTGVRQKLLLYFGEVGVDKSSAALRRILESVVRFYRLKGKVCLVGSM